MANIACLALTCNMQARKLCFSFSNAIHVPFPSSASLTCPLSAQSKFETTAACENYTTSKNMSKHIATLLRICLCNHCGSVHVSSSANNWNVMCSCLKLSPRPPSLLSLNPLCLPVFICWASLNSACLFGPRDEWMESWQCLQISHSMLVRLILLWREKLSEHTAKFVGLSSLTRQLLLRLLFMLKITQRRRLFKPNVSGWENRRQTHTLVTSLSFVPFSRPIYKEMFELCSQWTTPKPNTNTNPTPHTQHKSSSIYGYSVTY